MKKDPKKQAYIWPKKWPKYIVMEELKRSHCTAKSSNYNEELGEPFCRNLFFKSTGLLFQSLKKATAATTFGLHYHL